MNQKFQQWLVAIKALELGIHKKDLAPCLTSKSGKPVSQPMVSYITRGSQPFTEDHAKNISKVFYFTPEEYFLGTAPMFDINLLIKYLCAKLEITKKELSKHVPLSAPDISQLKNNSNTDNIQLVLDYFNDKLDLKLDALEINKTNLDAGYVPNSYMIPDMVKRLNDLTKAVVDTNRYRSQRQFAETLGINVGQFTQVSKSHGKFDVPRTFIIALTKELPDLNCRWFLTGVGPMFIKPDGTPFENLETSMANFLEYAKRLTEFNKMPNNPN